jgi:hypothetical protein
MFGRKMSKVVGLPTQSRNSGHDVMVKEEFPSAATTKVGAGFRSHSTLCPDQDTYKKLVKQAAKS